MGYVAVDHLRWGEEWIAPGEPIPEGDPARDYAGLLRTGQIIEQSNGDTSAGPVDVLKGLSDAELRAAVHEDERVRERLEEAITAGPPPPDLGSLTPKEFADLNDDTFAAVVEASTADDLKAKVDGDDELTARLVAAEKKSDKPRKGILALAD